MKVFVVAFASLLAVAECNLLQSYGLPEKEFSSSGYQGSHLVSHQGSHPISHQGSHLVSHQGSHHSSQNRNQGYQYLPPTTACADGQVLHVDGRCVTPVITRSVYLFNVPQLPRRPTPLPYIPPPKIDHNILFVRLPETLRRPDPIVVPPPQQKNIVYVLKKNTLDEGPRVIEVPAPPRTNPDVYFVGYDQGENPILPTGEDLQSVLANNVQEVYGQVVDTGSSINEANAGSFDFSNDGSFGHLDGDLLLPVTDFESHGHDSAGSFGGSVENILNGVASVDVGNKQDENAAFSSTLFNQGTSAPPFNYYIPPLFSQ